MKTRTGFRWLLGGRGPELVLSLCLTSGRTVLWWIFVSLLSISFVAVHPIIALGIAVLGGAAIGILTVLGVEPGKAGV